MRESLTALKQFLLAHREDILGKMMESPASLRSTAGRPESSGKENRPWDPRSAAEAILDLLTRMDNSDADPPREMPLFQQNPWEGDVTFLEFVHFLHDLEQTILNGARADGSVDPHDEAALVRELERIAEQFPQTKRRHRVPLSFEPRRNLPFDEETMQSERLAVTGQLAAGVAHEIGNPLTSISSIVQILRRKTEDPFFTEQLNHIKVSIDRIARIVHELVDFARPSPFNPQPANLNDIIHTAIGIMKYDRRVKRIEIETILAEHLPTLMLAKDQILQIFINLMINAADAMNGVGKIRIRSWADDEFVSASVADTGCGIPRIILPRIFDPFFTTKGVGEGTGLGLSVSYGIIQKHNGRIEVDSTVGEGSVFLVKFPLEPPA